MSIYIYIYTYYYICYPISLWYLLAGVRHRRLYLLFAPIITGLPSSNLAELWKITCFNGKTL